MSDETEKVTLSVEEIVANDVQKEEVSIQETKTKIEKLELYGRTFDRIF